MTLTEAKRACDVAKAVYEDAQFERRWGFAKQKDVDKAWEAYKEAKAVYERMVAEADSGQGRRECGGRFQGGICRLPRGHAGHCQD